MLLGRVWNGQLCSIGKQDVVCFGQVNGNFRRERAEGNAVVSSAAAVGQQDLAAILHP